MDCFFAILFQPLLTKYELQGSKKNFIYGLRVKPKEEYLHIRKCNSITNNSKNKIPGIYSPEFLLGIICDAII